MTVCSQTITIEQDLGPELVCPSNITINLDPGACDAIVDWIDPIACLLYTSPSPRDATLSRMPSSA